MNNEVYIELIKSLPAIIAALASIVTAFGVIIVGFLSYRANQQSRSNATKLDETNLQTKATAIRLEEVHHDVNGKMEQLLSVSIAKAHAEGLSEGESLPQKIEIPADDVVKVKLIDEEK